MRASDLLAADLTDPFQPQIPGLDPRQPITINWVITPPSPGSGGHTTIFRILRYLEARGYCNRVYFYDAYRGDHAYYASVVRSYYNFQGPLSSIDQGMSDAHIVMATAWPTAYPVFNARSAGRRCYFLQDFEPDFYARGSLSSLAECTYRMGFYGICIGSLIAEKLHAEFGMAVESFPFGCDLSRFHVQANQRRSGVVFYARRDSARRGTELGLLALELFAQRRPDLEIHIYGDKLGKLPFRFVDHGRLAPQAINTLYNQCFAGLSLSFTNLSLAPKEMLAAGCIPVTNDTAQARAELGSQSVRYAAPYPHALATQLEAVVSAPDFARLSANAAASVQGTSWDDAGRAVDTILRRLLAENTASSDSSSTSAGLHLTRHF